MRLKHPVELVQLRQGTIPIQGLSPGVLGQHGRIKLPSGLIDGTNFELAVQLQVNLQPSFSCDQDHRRVSRSTGLISLVRTQVRLGVSCCLFVSIWGAFLVYAARIAGS